MSGTRILLVDDEAAFTENMAKLLAHRGYSVRAVNSGKDALKALGEGPFDVVLLDLKMPGMDGLMTLGEIKKLGAAAEVVILTGHGSIDSALRAVKMGACDYLTKPCEIDELVSKIQGALAGKGKDERR